MVDFCGEHGDVLTNLKLQKLLYYAQAWHLALHDAPLFADDFVAANHGPVSPVVNEVYQEFSNRPIVADGEVIDAPAWLNRHLEEVVGAYGNLSAFDLERLSKDEDPWKSAWHKQDADAPLCVVVISKDSMKKYYRSKLGDEPKKT